MPSVLNLLAATALLAAPAAATPALPAVAQGTVVDASTGAPLPGVLVQQEGAVSSAFTQADGTFRLLTERAAGPCLVVSAIGFEPAHVPLKAGQPPIRVALEPISGFLPASPMLPADQLGQGPADSAPLNTGMVFAYRLRNQVMQAGGARLDGWANNDWRLGLRLRLRPLMLEAEGSHHETPVDLAGLSRQANPAFRPSTWQAGARVGLLTPVLHPDLEFVGAMGYRWTNTVPNNGDVPFTGSDLDWEQTRQAFGPVGTLAWRPGRGRFHAEASYGWYPWLLTAAKAPGRAFATSLLTDFRGVVGFELVPGARLGLGYQVDHWQGGGDDLARMWSVQLHYTPGGTPRGLEP
ncbi:MAG: carboxypeptidase-like regulatory domain-containing protein [Candidatus Sericytochromatia bacterium]|nr:carboxypeptidase-like regulatory domain-containing protein [Candidatus Sericytochromatia bacterium]